MMYNQYIVKLKRTQIYLTAGQDARLTKRAAGTRHTRSTLIREAIDAYLGNSEDADARMARFHAALDEIEQQPLSFPDGAGYVAELRSLDVEREEALERRRR
jgi:predicted DNA-binding protein